MTTAPQVPAELVAAFTTAYIGREGLGYHEGARAGVAAVVDHLLGTLPATNDDYRAWMRAHGLGHGAGVATVISAVRDDLRKLAGGAP